MRKPRRIAKMFWRKSRDILVETFTIVQRVELNFQNHEDKNDKQISGLHKLIKECHETCPEKDNFDQYVQEKNDTLLRMETKYDLFFDEFTTVKKCVNDMKVIKKTKGEILTTWLKYITIVGIIAGIIIGYLRYADTPKKKEAQTIMENK